MNVMITGGQGFLGRHLARRLVDFGYRIILFDRSPHETEVESRGLGITPVSPDLLIPIRGEVDDIDLLKEIIRSYRIEIVVHLATLLTEECARHPVMAARVNCVGTAAVFEASLSLGVRRVIFGSSVAVFGDAPALPKGDDRPYDPPSVYGATKVFGEYLARAMMKDHPDLELIGLRFGWIYGAGRVRGWTDIQKVIEGFALEEKLVPYPDYDLPNDWTYVSDAVEAIVQCLNSPRSSVVAYNVSGDYRPIQDAVRHLQRCFPYVQAKPYPAVLPRNAWDFQADRIVQEAGYQCRVKLEQGLDLAVDEIRRIHGLPPVG